MKTRKQKILATGIAAIMLSSCSATILAENTTNTVSTTASTEAAEAITLTAGALTAEYKAKDLDTDYDSSATRIECGSSVKISGSGASEADGVITISAAGTYVLSGSYSGQLVIEATKDDYVHLIFNGFEIESGSGPAVYAIQCDKLTITLADGTVNTITDSENYTFAEDDEDQEPDAALFSEDDMSINGGGTLNVTGNYADAIKCKKDLKLISGTYNITAVSEGIKGRNSVTVKDGTYTINSGDTAIKVTRDDDAEKGYVIIDGGTITINAGNDGIHAETHLTINGGDIDIQNAAEGIEGQMIDVTGGTVNVVASDDAFNASRIGGTSNKGGMGGFGGGMRQQGETGNTGDTQQQKNTPADASTDTQTQQGGMRGGRGGMNGDMNGMPPAGGMPGDMGGMNGDMGGMNGGMGGQRGGMRGDMNAMPGGMGGQRPDMNGDTAQSTDGSTENRGMRGGMNADAAQSTDDSTENRGMRGGMGGGMNGGMSRDDGQVYLNISGGTITVSGGADCLDSNGSISLTGGTIYASSPRYGITGTEGVLDADGAITFSEGITFIGTGTGSSISLTNEQNSLYIYEDSQQSAGTNITLKDSSGSVIASYTPNYAFTGIAITAPEIKTGETYTLVVGGSETSVTVSDKETTIGTASAGGMGGGFGGGMGGGMRGGKTYTDVDSSSSYSGAVSALSRMGAMNGTSDTTFSPDESLTRGMAVTVLGRMSRAQESTEASDFDDVDPDAYYAGYVTWAQNSDIVQGYGNGKFGVNDYITAKQLQTIIERYAKSAGFEYTADESASDELITRGEFAEVLFNAIASMMNSARGQNTPAV